MPASVLSRLVKFTMPWSFERFSKAPLVWFPIALIHLDREAEELSQADKKRQEALIELQDTSRCIIGVIGPFQTTETCISVNASFSYWTSLNCSLGEPSPLLPFQLSPLPFCREAETDKSRCFWTLLMDIQPPHYLATKRAACSTQFLVGVTGEVERRRAERGLKEGKGGGSCAVPIERNMHLKGQKSCTKRHVMQKGDMKFPKQLCVHSSKLTHFYIFVWGRGTTESRGCPYHGGLDGQLKVVAISMKGQKVLKRYINAKRVSAVRVQVKRSMWDNVGWKAKVIWGSKVKRTNC